jgi:cytidylate kinase
LNKKLQLQLTDFHPEKSTLAKQLAHNLGYVYVDTGAMYRAIALFAMQRGI